MLRRTLASLFAAPLLALHLLAQAPYVPPSDTAVAAKLEKGTIKAQR